MIPTSTLLKITHSLSSFSRSLSLSAWASPCFCRCLLMLNLVLFILPWPFSLGWSTESITVKTPFPLLWEVAPLPLAAAILEEAASAWGKFKQVISNCFLFVQKVKIKAAANTESTECVSDLLQVWECDTPNICQPMFSVIPATVRQVNPTNEGHWLVDDNDLLVMCPQVDGGGDMVWMTHHLWRRSQKVRQETWMCRMIHLWGADSPWCWGEGAAVFFCCILSWCPEPTPPPCTASRRSALLVAVETTTQTQCYTSGSYDITSRQRGGTKRHFYWLFWGFLAEIWPVKKNISRSPLCVSEHSPGASGCPRQPASSGISLDSTCGASHTVRHHI